MAKITFETPKGNKCYGCMAFNSHSFYCEIFKEFLHNEHGCAGALKCEQCKELDKRRGLNETTKKQKFATYI